MRDPDKYSIQRWRTHWRATFELICLAFVAAAILLFRLGRGALQDWDEAIYAEVSKQIVIRHDWLTPYYVQHLFFEKPPLILWCQALVFRCFGATEFWARFPSAAAGIGVVWLAYAIGKRSGGSLAGILAALILLTTRTFVDLSRQGMMDTPLCLWIYCAIYAYIRVRDGAPQWFYPTCVAIGLAVMTKGPAALVAPMAMGVEMFLRKSQLPALGWKKLCAAGLIIVGIAAPWHVWMILLYHAAFINEYFKHQLVLRTTQPLETPGGQFLYLTEFPLGAFPWSVLAIPAAIWSFRRRRWDLALLGALVFVTMVVYTIVRTKHVQYIEPVYPAVAIVVALFLADLCAGRRILRLAVFAVFAMGIGWTFSRIWLRTGNMVSNQMAQVAKVAGQHNKTEPLLILSDPKMDLDADTNTPTFYSDRAAESAEIPKDANRLEESFMNRTSIDAIIQKSAIDVVPSRYEIHPIAQNDLFVYGTISRKF